MTASVLQLAFAAWVLFQAWRGFRAGVWAGVFGIIGLVAAYAVSLFYGVDVTAMLTKLGVSEHIALFVAYFALFLIVNTLVRHLPFILLPVLKHKGRTHAWLGAALGTLTGVVTGLLGVWFIGVVQAVLSPPSINDDSLSLDIERQVHVSQTGVGAEPSALSNIATSFVAKTAALSASTVGIEENSVVTVSAMVRQPDVVMGGMQSLMKSEQMHALLRSEHARRMMALNDVSSLQSSREFKSVIELPAMQTMTNSLQLEGGDEAKSERFIAEQMTHIWRRMEYLKSDPRAQALLKDEGLQSALQSKNPMALMANTKYQQLVALVLNGTTDVSETEFNQVLLSSISQPSGSVGDASTDLNGMPESKPYSPQTVYKWKDDRGKWQYSDWERIPVSKRDTAEVMMR